jgi:hypothetical protein
MWELTEQQSTWMRSLFDEDIRRYMDRKFLCRIMIRHPMFVSLIIVSPDDNFDWNEVPK